jgi:hypothetical protein
MSVDGNPPGWAIVGSNTGQTITFSAGNCGNSGFMVHFTLTVTSLANGCTSTCTASFAPGAPACVVDIRPPVVLNCNVTSEYLLASYSTDIVNPTFEWMLGSTSLGAGINDGVSLDSILITGPGTYTFFIHDPANSANDCFASVTVTQDIATPSCSIATPTSTVFCSSIGDTLHVSASGGTGPYTFSWSVSGTGWVITSGANSSQIIYSVGSSGSATFTVVVTGANGCSSTCTISITCTSPFGGCTLGFWKNHPAIWNASSQSIPSCVASAAASLGYGGNGTTSASFAATFGVTAAQMTAAGYSPSLTLLQALNLGGGGFMQLARQGVAAVLNSCSFSQNFPYTTVQLLTSIHNAIVTLTSQPLGNQLGAANEQQPEMCPPGGHATPNARPANGNLMSDNIMMGAYPNPFTSSVAIEFTLNTFSANAQVDVYSMNGTLVATLFNGNAEDGVTYKVNFDGSNYANGIYFCRINAADHSNYIKLVLFK